MTYALPQPLRAEAQPLSTPRPVYAAPVPAVTPPTMAFQERTAAMNAAVRATQRYPGPAGLILAGEIRAFAEMTYLGHPQAPIRQLIAELLRENSE